MLTTDGIIDSLKNKKWLEDRSHYSIRIPPPNTKSRFYQKIEIGPDGEPHVVPTEKDPKSSATPE
jgi:hypothetical protein